VPDAEMLPNTVIFAALNPPLALRLFKKRVEAEEVLSNV
jgi:hypothetical protein